MNRKEVESGVQSFASKIQQTIQEMAMKAFDSMTESEREYLKNGRNETFLARCLIIGLDMEEIQELFNVASIEDNKKKIRRTVRHVLSPQRQSSRES